MRRHLGEHLRRIPLQILYRQRSGELNALLAGTIDETYNHTLIVSNMLIAAVFTPLATALITLIWDWRLGLILLISFPLIVPIQHGTQPLMARAKARLARANASLNAELLEYSQGLPILKAANSAGTHLPRLQQAIGAVETIQRDALLAEALPNALLGSAVLLLMLLILLAGMVWLTGGSLDAWLLAALMVACIRFAEPLGQILSMSSIYSMVQQGYARLQELLAVAPLERVGDIGGKLSGGERQRITIARAILQNRPVLILDEATAFADAENEALLMRALAALMQDKTVLMIAHRLATIRHAAQILVFDHGQLVEQGDHASLIAQNGRYARLWQAGEAARHWRIGSAE